MVSPEGSAGRWSTFTLTHVAIAQTQFLAGCRPESALCSLCWTAHSRAGGFLRKSCIRAQEGKQHRSWSPAILNSEGVSHSLYCPFLFRNKSRACITQELELHRAKGVGSSGAIPKLPLKQRNSASGELVLPSHEPQCPRDASEGILFEGNRHRGSRPLVLLAPRSSPSPPSSS